MDLLRMLKVNIKLKDIWKKLAIWIMIGINHITLIFIFLIKIKDKLQNYYFVKWSNNSSTLIRLKIF
jgi:hypothetical protein